MLKKGEQTREKILDCAEKVFSSKGYYESQVSDISRMAKVAKGTVYQYFTNKESLFVTLIEEYVSAWEKEVELDLQNFVGADLGRTYADAYLRHRISKTIRFFLVNQDRTNIILRMSLGLNDVIEQVVRIFEDKVLKTIVDDIKVGQKFGHIGKNMDVELTANSILGAFMRGAYYYFVLRKESYLKYSEESFTDEVCRLVQYTLNMYHPEE